MSRNIIRRKLLQQPEHVLSAGEFYICVPEESTNLITNPSGEVDTTGWGATGLGVSVARDTTESYYGAASIKMTDTAATGSGEYIQSGAATASAGELYTLSFRYKKKATGAQTGIASIAFYTSGSVYISETSITLARGNVSQWQYATLTARAPATTGLAAILFKTDGVTSGQFELWVDGVQLEAKPYATTYIDGDQEDCIWTGARHASASYRPPTTRKGGRLQPMSNYKFKIGAIIGAGAAALSTLATPYAQTGGGYYQGSIAPPRAITITGAFECSSAIDLARRRAELYNAVTPLATPQGQPARLVYVPQSCGGNIAEGVVIDGVYSGGLEGNTTNDIGYERAALTFTTYLPFAAIGKSVKDGGAALSLSQSLASSNNIVTRNKITGAWSTLGSGANNSVDAVIASPDGLAYAAGTFTTIGGVSANNAAKWTGSTFTALGSGPGSVYTYQASAVGPDGSLYYAHEVTPAGAQMRVKKWDGSSWSTLGGDFVGNGDGLGQFIKALVVAPDGTLYAGGKWDTIGGAARGNVVKWDGSAWVNVSTAPNGNVWSLAVDKAGNLYAGGTFTTIGGVSAARVAKWNGSAWSALGSGITSGGSATVSVLYVARDGSLYAAGEFTTAGGVSASCVAVWNGSGWYPLGAGINSGALYLYPASFYEDESPGVILNGVYSTVSNSNLRYNARWSGSTWVPGPSFPNPVAGTTPISRVATSSIYELVGGVFSAISVPAITAITTTTQTNEITLTITGPGTPVLLRNYTTGDEVLFNLTLNAGETLTLDTGTKFTARSNWRGDMSGAIISGSSISRFRLLPGVNNIAFLMINTTGASAAAIVYKEMYASLDYTQ